MANLLRPSQLSLRTALTVCLTAACVALGAYLLYRARGAVAAILTAALVATALSRIIDALVRHSLKRSVANALVLTALVVSLGGLSWAFVPVAAGQASEFVDRAPEMWKQVRESSFARRVERRFHVQEKIEKQAEKGGSPPITEVAPPALAALGGALTLLARIATVLFLVVFMVLFGRDLVRAAAAEVLPDARDRIERILSAVYDSVGGYLTGLFFVCTINATVTTAFLAFTGMPWFLPLGILSGFSSLVPYAGPFAAGSLITLLAFTTGGVWHGVATLIYFVVYDSLEGNVLAPLVFRRTVHLNPLVALLAVVLFAEFAGVLGAVIAVPVAAAGQIILREYFAERRAQLRSAG